MKLCSAGVKLSECARQMCWWCSFNLVSVDRLVCPMYTCPDLQLMLLHTQSLQSLIVLNKGNEAGDLGWRSTLLELYLDSILLMWLKFVWICSRKVIEVGFAQGLVVLTTLLLSSVEPVSQTFSTDLYIL
jgi:hypothetical protein